MKYQVTFLITLIIFISSCLSAKLVEPTPEDLQRAQALNPNTTMEQLQQGKNYYQTFCRKCHGLKRITNYTPQEWEKIVPEMREKHNKKFRNEPMTEEQQQTLLTYLKTISQRKNP